MTSRPEPRLLSWFNVGPRECPPQVTSTSSITKLPPDAKLWSKDISLAYTGPAAASSFINHSKKLDLPQELIDAAKSFTLYLSPTDETSVTKSPVINRTPPISCTPKKRKQPTFGDALAALVKEPVNKKRTTRVVCEQVESSHANDQLQIVCWAPLANQHKEPDKNRKIPPKVDCGRVNKKKITKRVECEQAESSHADDHLQIVCWQPSASQHNEQEKKKRNVPPKIDCGPVVKNEVTEQLQRFITDEMNGSDLKLVIQKVLYMSDLEPGQNRLNLPQKQLITEDFLSDEERWILKEEKGEIEVGLVGPTLKMYKGMGLKIWGMRRTDNYVLKTKWKEFVQENTEYLEKHSKIQLWSFRKDQQLCFALAVVDGPPLYLMA